MARKPKTRRFRGFRRHRARKGPRKFPILPIVAGVGSIWAGADGRMSAGAWIQSGRLWNPQGMDLYHFANDFMAQYTGIDTREGFPRFSIPWGTVTILAGVIGSRIAGMLGANKVFNSLPKPLNRLKF
jgi:hypothetical protein